MMIGEKEIMQPGCAGYVFHYGLDSASGVHNRLLLLKSDGRGIKIYLLEWV